MHLRAHAAPAKTRRYPRTVFCVPLMLHHLTAGGVRKTRGISLDIGEGGLGALLEGSLTVGEMVAIDLPLDQHVLNAVAVVRYSTPANTGFEFVGLTAEERMQIASVVGIG